MGKISSVTGKMPFAGRSLVENAAMDAFSERTSLSEKAMKCARSAGFLACFGALHALQAKMGGIDFMHDATAFVENPNVLDGAETIISGLYTAANAAVTYTQLEVAGRVANNYFRFRDAVHGGGGLSLRDREYTWQSPTAFEILFTLAAQMTFMAQRDI